MYFLGLSHYPLFAGVDSGHRWKKNLDEQISLDDWLITLRGDCWFSAGVDEEFCYYSREGSQLIDAIQRAVAKQLTEAPPRGVDTKKVWFNF